MVEVAYEIRSRLGEGPIWDAHAGVLYWLDIFQPSINRFDPTGGTNRATLLPQPVYAAALAASGGLLGALEEGFAFIAPESGDTRPISNPNQGQPVNFNDGKCDRRGRFWTGTMAKDWESPIGTLYCLDNGLRVRAMDTGFILSNGLGWSPDNKTMYFTDFKKSTIYAYDFDIDTGEIAERRAFINVPQHWGYPDGMTVDADGCLWVALWDGWRVVRYNASGGVEEVVEMPVQRPTSCAFGGPDLSTLYITSASMHLSEADIAKGPLAGSLFVLESDARGLLETPFSAGKGAAGSA